MNKSFLSSLIGVSYGSKKVTNKSISLKFPEWDENSITNKIGVKQRFHVLPNEDSVDLSYSSCDDFFSKHVINKNKIDFIIFVTSSPRYVTPSSSQLIHEYLDLNKSCGCVDLNQGCSGYIYGLSFAKALLESNQANNILLITSETYSKYIDENDKGNLTIFGDASTCSLITNEHEKNSWSLSNSYFGSDGKGSDFIKIQNNILKMDGKSVFNFASNTVINDLKTYLDFPYSEYYFLFHQANSFMLNYLRKKMKIPKDKFLIDMENSGNTVSSSIPLVLSKNNPNKMILVGFGVGLSWGFIKLN